MCASTLAQIVIQLLQESLAVRQIITAAPALIGHDLIIVAIVHHRIFRIHKSEGIGEGKIAEVSHLVVQHILAEDR